MLVTRASNIIRFPKWRKEDRRRLQHNQRHAVADQSRHKNDVTLVLVKDRDEGVDALEFGRVDGFASDKLLLAGAQVKKSDALGLLPDDLSIEQYVIVVPRGDWAMLPARREHRASPGVPQRTDARIVRATGSSAESPGLLLEAGLHARPDRGLMVRHR